MAPIWLVTSPDSLSVLRICSRYLTGTFHRSAISRAGVASRPPAPARWISALNPYSLLVETFIDEFLSNDWEYIQQVEPRRQTKNGECGMGRQGDKGTRRQGNKETRRQGEGSFF